MIESAVNKKLNTVEVLVPKALIDSINRYDEPFQ